MLDPVLVPWAVELGNPATRQAEDIMWHLRVIRNPGIPHVSGLPACAFGRQGGTDWATRSRRSRSRLDV